MLIDTVAAISLLRYGNSIQEIVPREDIIIIGFGGSSIGVLGETIVDMDIETMHFKVICVICSEQIPLELEGLLSRDSLQKLVLRLISVRTKWYFGRTSELGWKMEIRIRQSLWVQNQVSK